MSDERLRSFIIICSVRHALSTDHLLDELAPSSHLACLQSSVANELLHVVIRCRVFQELNP